MTKTCLTRSRKMFLAALGLTAVVPTASHAQAPPLGTTANFAVLGGSTVTNTGPTVLTGTAANPGNLGVSPGSSITGFLPVDLGPGTLTGPGATININNAAAIQAQIDLTTAFNTLASRPTTVNLTGQNLGGLTLIPGVYNFSSSAQLTGALTLNALGNPNAVFIFNIGSTLTTASASAVSLINGAQGGNVFWRVGSSATLGTSTSFAGDILANASITLNTGANITCGAAWARTGAVTLDTNTISLCDLIVGGGGGGVPLLASLLLPSATANQRSVANAIDTFVGNGGVLPLPFLNLFNLSSADLGNSLTQLSGESGTGIAQAGTQAMNSFLSLVTNPFADNRALPPVNPPSRPPLYAKAPFYKAAAAPVADPRRWSVWGAAYGGQTTTSGDALNGSHDRSARSYGFATGLDYRVSPYTVAGFALAGGNTNYGLSDGLGGGSSDMFQAAVYSLTRVGAAYVSAALAYGWHQVSTDRVVTVAGLDRLTAGFAANSVGGRIEGGYRFAIPGVYAFPGFGFTPYAAFQMQAFRTPSYSEIAVSGSSMFALDYQAHTTTTTRTELGAWVDRSLLLYPGAMLSLRGRAAWAHDNWSDTSMTAGFQSLPGSIFTVIGATPVKDSLLVSAVAEVSFRNGISVAGKFDTEQAAHSQTYVGTARLRYAW
ncbi:ice-binding family protein [Bradyrhizobium sp.]|uniref:ice-binding family protein n=1 Tax=Bradyrhizobium sp. TaxID=376 RepID=UPI0027377356|nr:ice-binding family protein [Bradyrhizobium sp.]MDP3076158.1 ice-binding family protein [Bradyrhizobium sp.]